MMKTVRSSLTSWNALVAMGVMVLLVTMLLLIQPVQATNGVLYAAPTAQGSGDCSSWGNACTLPTALNTATSGYQIWVQEGVHYPGTARSDSFLLKNNVEVYGGFAGTENTLSQRDWEENITILSGDIDQNDTNTDGNSIAETWNDLQGSNSYHVVNGNNTNNTAVLDGFVVTAGQANSGAWDHVGGGIFNWNGTSPTIRNTIISGNLAEFGGGMYNHYGNSPVLENVTFYGNAGGGMYNYYSNPTLTNVTFSSNSGGGMNNTGSSSPTLTNALFSANSGGGMNNNTHSSPTLTNVTFIANTNEYNGGGMYLSNYSNPTLVNVKFYGNTASYGAGLYIYNWSEPTLVNVTFSGNTATEQGGGICNYGGHPTLTNIILWGNSAPTNPEFADLNSDGSTIRYSIVKGGCPNAATCSNVLDADPRFVNPDVGNLQLGPGSAAIDAGDNTAVPGGITTDLDGNPRFVDTVTIPDSGNGTAPIVDMGAYEAQPDSTPPTVESITRLDTNPTNAGSVEFLISFSESVAGVEADDFSLTTSGLSGALITGVDGGTQVYTVTVSTGSGDGTLRLDIPDTATIVDLSNNLSGLPYESGEEYTIDKTAPTVVSITRLDPNPSDGGEVRFEVTFSEAVSGVGAADFSLHKGGSISGESIKGVTGSGTTYTVTVDTGTGGGKLRLDVAGTAVVSDAAGNALTDLPYESGEEYTIYYKLYLPLILKLTP